jgi:hypothetical protein
MLLQYVGFQDAPGRREYVLMAQSGDKVRKYTVWIASDAFAKRQASMQDGPDICYQKLARALIDPELATAVRLEVTDADLTHYREAHAPVKGRSHPRRPFADAQPLAADADREPR